MAEFHCRVADTTGRIFEQVETARTEAEARQRLVDRGLFVYSVRPRLALPTLTLGRGKKRRRLRAGDFLLFNQQFMTLIRAGLPILKSLDLLAERAARPSMRGYLNDIRERVRNGASVSDAFEAMGVFPKVYTTSLLAGERSGNLAGVLEYFLAFQRTTLAARRRFVAALIYPAILVVIITAVLSLMLVWVVPKFHELYAEAHAQLPPLTEMVIGISLAIRQFALLGSLVLLAVFAGGYSWLGSERGRLFLDRGKMRLPILGDVWIKYQTAQFSRTLATLLSGGTPLVNSLETAASSVPSPLIGSALSKANRRVKDGQSLHASLEATALLPPMAIEMIEVGEATGALPQMLTSVAEFYEEDVNTSMATLTSLIEPAMLLFMGFVVAFILISLYLPIFSLGAQTR
ncbi:MAG TPA: type II secretion system F family protein [Candidatus Acidoferrales bacterium]